MQQPAAASPAIRGGSFASTLAAFAAPAPKPQPDWNLDGLADDVATLSYEQALRAHARYRPAGDLPPEPNATADQHQQRKLPSKHMVAEELSLSRGEHPAKAPTTDGRRSAALDETRKAASITIRLSKAECAQLHKRAAEAGLTVSAYLRSCTCEVEALRAQVKEALVQLRPVAARDEQKPAGLSPSTSRTWWSRLVLRWRSRRRPTRA
jgi:hypothetical protein